MPKICRRVTIKQASQRRRQIHPCVDNIDPNVGVGIGIGSIPAWWDRYFRLSSSSAFTAFQPAHVPSETCPCKRHSFHISHSSSSSSSPPAVVPSRDSAAPRAAVRWGHVLRTTDGVTDHDRGKMLSAAGSYFTPANDDTANCNSCQSVINDCSNH